MKLHGNARTCPKSRRLLVERIESEAAAHGTAVSGSELVGLMPAAAAAAAAGSALRIDGFAPSRVLELRLLEQDAGLD